MSEIPTMDEIKSVKKAGARKPKTKDPVPEIAGEEDNLGIVKLLNDQKAWLAAEFGKISKRLQKVEKANEKPQKISNWLGTEESKTFGILSIVDTHPSLYGNC